MSKLKRWKLVRVVRKSTIVDLVALRAAEKSVDEQAAAAIEVKGSGELSGTSMIVDSLPASAVLLVGIRRARDSYMASKLYRD